MQKGGQVEMGSGKNGRYSGTRGNSQPYAKSYGVCKDMKRADMKNGVCSKKGYYTKNPTAQNFKDLINGNYIGDKKTSFHVPYVIDKKGNIIVGKRNGNGSNGLPTPHPTLIGGKDPRVKCAGILEIAGGKIYKIDVNSGHFKPNAKSLPAAKKLFEKLPKKLFHKKYEWSK